MSGYVAIEIEGVAQTHASGHPTGNYDTLCGLEANDPGIGHKLVGVIIGSRIDCDHCIALIRAAKEYRERDFQLELRK